MKYLAGLMFLFIFTAAFAGYNPYTGNTYTVTPNGGGGATVQGFNTNTGSNWNTTIQSNGNMNGVDAKGNMWDYNRQTGTYMNYGTGTICTGSGYTRTCS